MGLPVPTTYVFSEKQEKEDNLLQKICRYYWNNSVTVSPCGMQCPGLLWSLQSKGPVGEGTWLDSDLIVCPLLLCMYGLTLSMPSSFSCFCCRLLTFFKINFFEKTLAGIPSECQTVWIQIRTDILSVPTFCAEVINRWQKSPLARKEILERPFYMYFSFTLFPTENE